jgi:TRAP-type C4-dicarboxylate transport system permease small subunit
MEQAVKHPAISAEELAQSFEEADHVDVSLSGYSPEDWITLGIFWVMVALVFLQFFSRYALNDSYAWTEELATYCLIGVVFIGASMCTRKDRHIQVDVLYRFIPASAARVLATLVDLLRAGFIGYVTLLVWKYTEIVGDEPMTTLNNWPKNVVYWVALAGFAIMTIRALQIAWKNWHQGYSILERPEAYDGTAEG